jgi:hypothetical protein
MFDFVKNIFRKRYLRRSASHTQTGLMPVSRMKSVSVFINAEDKESDDCKEKVLAYFKSRGIKVDIFFFDFSKKSKEERQITSLNTTTLRKDLNWCGKPSRDKASQMLQANADVFISLIDNTDFPIVYMAKCSPAKFKIGRRQIPGRTFDLVVENSPSGNYSQPEAFDEITRLLEKIG